MSRFIQNRETRWRGLALASAHAQRVIETDSTTALLLGTLGGGLGSTYSFSQSSPPTLWVASFAKLPLSSKFLSIARACVWEGCGELDSQVFLDWEGESLCSGFS